MNIITDRAFLWFEDRFYIATKEEILKAYDEGATLHPKVHAAIVEGSPEVWFPSSTTILGAAPKPWLAEWKGRVGNEEAERRLIEGGNKGANIHEAIRIYLGGGLVIYNYPRKPAFTSEELTEIINDATAAKREYIVLREQQELLEAYRAKQWFDTVNPTIIATEFTVVSLKHMYAGTCDLLCHIEAGTYNICGSKPLTLKKGLYAVDYKTGKTEDKVNWFRQTASYAQAIEENGEYSNIEGCLVIHTNDNKIKGGIEGLKTYYQDKTGIEKSFDEFLKIKAVYDIDLDYQPKVIELPAILSKAEIIIPSGTITEETVKEPSQDKPKTVKKNGKAKKPAVNSVFDEE